MLEFHIPPLDESLRPAVQAKIDNLNKPLGALGRLEELAMQVCLIQQTLTPTTTGRCHLLLGGDHGIEREGVSVSPREITWQQMINFTRGGGGINMFCRQHGFDLRIVDVGVDHDLGGVDGIIDRKIARGTRNFRHEAAMSPAEMEQAIAVGAQLVDECAAEGCKVLSVGEMGIGNTSPSSVWMHLLADIPLDLCIGAGAGLDTAGIRHKRDVLSEAVARFHQMHSTNLGAYPRLRPPEASTPVGTETTEDIITHFGGFEMVAAVGAMLRGAEHRMVVLVDGFIMTACALAAVTLYPAAKDYMVFTHCGDESGHLRMLQSLQAKPLLQLGLRLGEGTGALCAFPLIDSAVRMVNEMNNFDNARITKYF